MNPLRVQRNFLKACAIAVVILLPKSAPAQEISTPLVTEAVVPGSASVTFEAFRAIPTASPWEPGDPVKIRGDLKSENRRIPARTPNAGTQLDSQVPEVVFAPPGQLAQITTTFDGIPATGYLPPDISLAVGPNHIIQMINSGLAIYDKVGRRLLGTIDINVLWNDFGGACDSENSGDPIVRHDELADRWLVSQFALPEEYQCIAISKGPNPISSGWYLYAFPTLNEQGKEVTPDYPKIGVWPNGYYMGTQRGFPSGGLDVWAFERDKMLAGEPARQVHFSMKAPSLFLMPSDFDGTPPLENAPNVFLRHVDGDQFGGDDRLELFEFSVNWNSPDKSSFKLVSTLQTAPFDATLCGDMFAGNCATQLGTPQKLDTIPAWLMWRAQYRNFVNHESLVLNHTVNAGGNDIAGIRWYELRKDQKNNWFIYQEGTHAPDAMHRWMGSIAMDSFGNIALGYTVSSNLLYPSMRVATRGRNDPLNIMGESELSLVNGAGSQTSTSGRWGDYSAMEVDPSEDCTFWYSNQYYKTTSEAGWLTRIVQFRMPECK